MILAFDPVAGELLVDFETEGPPATVPLKQLVVKYYAPTAGTVACTMNSDGLELCYYPIPGEPNKMALAPTGRRSCRIVFVSEDYRSDP